MPNKRDTINYYTLSNEQRMADAFLGICQDELNDESLLLQVGKEVNSFGRYWMEVTEGIGLNDYPWNTLNLPIMSSRFVKAIREYGISNVQFFPIIIRYGNKIINDYSICNITGFASAMNKGKSNYTTYDMPGVENDVLLIINLVFKTGVKCENEIFRLEEYSPTIVVTRKFTKNLESYKFKGVFFRPIEESD